MSSNIKIVDGSIILSYSFTYDAKSVKQTGDLPKVDNLLSYADRIFEKNKIYTYNTISKNIVLRIGESEKFKTYSLTLKYANILFFQDNIAMLYMHITPSTKDLDSLYEINRALTQFYTKQKTDEAFIYFGKNKFGTINIPIEEFKKHIKEYLSLKDKTLQKENKDFFEALSIALNQNTSKVGEIFSHENLKISQYTKNKSCFLKITLLHLDTFTRFLFNHYSSLYSPYENPTKDYPFNNETKVDNFSGRVGPTKAEKYNIIAQNTDIDTKKSKPNRHYLYFENQLKLVNQKNREENKFEFIHYDTFVTSLILKFVASNTRFLYYDNFNPIATNYINSYITLVCDNLDDNEYINNFLSFEPLLHSKVSKGKKIMNSDFFHIYQSQADIFTLGNSHSIVHILDKKDVHIKNNKETTHFYTYLLTTVQRNFILNIISSSIINLNNVGDKKTSISDIKHIFIQLTNTLNKFNMFLTNYNFKVISNSSSVDNSYNFFRKCNEVDKLTTQWGAISFKMKDWKSILSHILQKRPIYLFIIMVILLALLNVFNRLLNTISDFFPSFLDIFHVTKSIINETVPKITHFFTSF